METAEGLRPARGKRQTVAGRTEPFRVARGRSLPTTAVFDTFWRFACERQNVFLRRVVGQQPPPWTKDAILQSFRFTNVYRASDRVSQFLIRHVIYEGDPREEEVFFRTILFKLFNRIDTWKALEQSLGPITWREFRHDRYDRVLSQLMECGRKVYSGAYIMPSPPFAAKRKHTNHLMLLARMMQDGVPFRVASARSLSEVFQLLRSYPSLGDFLAFQFTIDLNYGPLTDFSEMDFVVAGPGAKSGIKKAFPHTSGLDFEDVIRAVADHAIREISARGLSFEDLWGRSLQLIDCQNLFCEVDKYTRVAHPEIGRSSRTRIKQRYRASKQRLPQQWYPPKWRLQPPQPVADGQTQRNEEQRDCFPLSRRMDEQPKVSLIPL